MESIIPTLFLTFLTAIILSAKSALLAHSPINTVHNSMSINMPDVSPSLYDAYVCTAKKLPAAESYIVQYEPDADGRNVHHLLLFGCESLHSQSHLYPGHWRCGGNLCNQMTIMYGWAKNAPSMKLPPNVGFPVGGNSSIQYLVLQVHYSGHIQKGVTDNSGLKIQMTSERQPSIIGIHLLLAETARIPPHRPKFHIDVNCRFKGETPIHVFAYRAHTHSLGTVVSGYSLNLKNSSWTFLAKANPQWPQAFYPMQETMITSDDVLVARCTYNSEKRIRPVQIGSSSSDEMCNLYLMYYVEHLGKHINHFPPCVDTENNDWSQELPPGNDEIFAALGQESLNTRIQMNTLAHNKQSRIYPSDPARMHRNQSNFPNQHESETDFEMNHPFRYKASMGWTSPDFQFGQISAVTVDKQGNPVIFHRGDHVWGKHTFDHYDKYSLSSEGPISVPTIVTIDTVSGLMIDQWGADLFYMPHGLYIDSNENYWVTDVALHQVFCFRKADRKTPILVLGERFVPGNDREHFCKPASAVVSKKGDVYIADGYCNSRIVHFSYNGKFLKQWGKANNYFDNNPPIGTFNIPHKVILLEDRDLVCVADRENGRIQCFLNDGRFRFQIQIEEFKGTVYSIAYSETNGLLFAVSGEAVYHDHPVKAFIFNVTNQQLLSEIVPPSGSFSRPHDIASTSDGEELYICEIGPNVVWKFLRDYHKSSKKVLNDEIPETARSLPTSIQNMKMFPAVGNNSYDAKSEDASEGSGFEISVVVMSLLGIPVLLLILIMTIIRLRKRGKLQNFSLMGHLKGWLGGYRAPQHEEKFNIGHFLNRHKGFDKVSVEGSDESESENEEFNTATTNKA